MNRNLLIVAVVVVILLALGGFLLMNKGRETSNENKPAAVNPTENPNIFTTIKDALSRSISLECDFTTDSGQHIKSSIKNGAVRADITSSKQSESGSVIVKDNKIYFWNAQGGFVMAMPDVTVSPSPQSASAKTAQGQDILNSLEKYKKSCHSAVVADSLFVPPSDVKFQDLSSMMKSIPSGIPSVNPSAYQRPSY